MRVSGLMASVVCGKVVVLNACPLKSLVACPSGGYVVGPSDTVGKEEKEREEENMERRARIKNAACQTSLLQLRCFVFLCQTMHAYGERAFDGLETRGAKVTTCLCFGEMGNERYEDSWLDDGQKGGKNAHIWDV